MSVSRIHITGASGAGTTTLGRALAARLACPFFDADDYFWEPTQPPFQTKRSREDRLRMAAGAISQSPRFVLAGSVCGWGAALEDGFDLIVYLYLPPDLRLARLREREMARYGRINQEFIDWAARYDEGDLSIRSRRLHECWLRERSCEVVRLEGDMTVDDRIEAILAASRSPRSPC